MLEGRVQPSQQVSPPFKGTLVEMGFNTDREIDFTNTVLGRPPITFDVGTLEPLEDAKGNIVVKVKDYATSFDDPTTAQNIKNMAISFLNNHSGHAVEIDMSEVEEITVEFADELFWSIIH